MKRFNITDTYDHPVKMAIAVVAVLLACQLFIFLLQPLMPALIDERSAWVVTVAMLLFYILFNCISTFNTKSVTRHWNLSIYGLALLGTIGYIISFLISGKSIRELSGFRDIILIVLIGFFVLKTIATTIKAIVVLTKKRDSLGK